jgi:glucosamine-6-phosphate deaminase
MNIHIYRNKKELDKAVADILIESVMRNPKITLGLATGSTPIGVYELLIKDHQMNHTDYAQVTNVNLDEYVKIGKNHPESYFSFMKKNLFDHINIQMTQVHLPDGEADDLDEACKAYNAVLTDHTPDIQILGIGGNGHIGFNEPGTPFDVKTHIVKLAEKTRKDNARFFNTLDEVPKEAITMGIQNIMDAKKIILMASGANKAEAVKQMLSGPITEDLPASILQNHPDVEVFIDKEAAKLIL